VPAPSYDIIRDDPHAPGGGSRLCALAHSPQALIGYMHGGQCQQPQALAPYVQQDGGKVFRVAVDIGIEFRPEELQV